MGIINELDSHLVELISAGEVVERPASVVKEFMENSIDAQATSITVEIRNGGCSYIRITDNGVGMSADDVRKAFKNHATSKIKSSEDLENIVTMGFRGEALASVAAVARVETLTRARGEEYGTLYVISGSKEENCEEVGCPEGTTIIVKDIFYNTPARMKFLKKDSSEGNYVQTAVERIAVAYPEIKIKFIRDGETRLLTSGNGSLKEAIFEVFGKETAENLIEVSYESDGIGVSGYISKPSYSRGNRTYQNFYVNKRYFQSKMVAAALEEGYKGSIMVGKFPACTLNITIDPRKVDVNVHPAKIEVRFQEEKAVFRAIYYAVKTALSKNDNNIFTSSEEEKKEEPVKEQTEIQKSIGQEFFVDKTSEIKENDIGAADTDKINVLNIEKEYRMPAEDTADYQYLKDRERMITADAAADEKYVSGSESLSKSSYENQKIEENTDEIERKENILDNNLTKNKKTIRIIGEVLETYIVLECDGTVIFVDKHAAHERLIYEKIVKEGEGQERQLLLEPIAIKLSSADYTAIVENYEITEKIGFEIEDFGVGNILVRSAPMWAERSDIRTLIEEIASNISLNKNSFSPDALDNLYHSVACRSAIKAGDKSDMGQYRALIEKMIEDGSIKYCPHGRPVAIELTEKQLEKMFGRIQ